MKKLSKEKRNQLIIVVLITAGVLTLLFFGMIRPSSSPLPKSRMIKMPPTPSFKRSRPPLKTLMP